MSGQSIKSRRVAMSISQIEMARLIGVTQSTYSRYENNHDKIPLKIMKRIAHVFHVSLNDLLPDETTVTNKNVHDNHSDILTKSYFDEKMNEMLLKMKQIPFSAIE